VLSGNESRLPVGQYEYEKQKKETKPLFKPSKEQRSAAKEYEDYLVKQRMGLRQRGEAERFLARMTK
jgi:hypothetical protein